MNVMITGVLVKENSIIEIYDYAIKETGRTFLIFDFKNDFSNDPTFLKWEVLNM